MPVTPEEADNLNQKESEFLAEAVGFIDRCIEGHSHWAGDGYFFAFKELVENSSVNKGFLCWLGIQRTFIPERIVMRKLVKLYEETGWKAKFDGTYLLLIQK